MNQQMFQEHSDYLLMLNSPDYNNLHSPLKPEYVNDIQFHECPDSPGEASGYLTMKPSSVIFSPRADERTVFNFDRRKPNEDNAVALPPETLPMLYTNSDCSDNEMSPTFSKSFSNPSYQRGLTIANEKTDDIVKTSDNYVNLPQQKMILNKEKKSLAELLSSDVKDNPADTNSLSRNYVNNQSRDWERACMA